MMPNNNDIRELFDRFVNIENEIKLLQEDKKSLLEEFKDRIDPTSFRAALRAAKIKSRVKPAERDGYETILEQIEKRLCIEHLE